jgi:bifunctional ADP-heptose synthase (sugar kinase/adenylyltransferase)
VDYCVVFRDRTVDRLLEAVRPDIHAKGTDYSEDSVPERETVERLGGKVMIVGPPRERSTSEILRKLSGANDG